VRLRPPVHRQSKVVSDWSSISTCRSVPQLGYLVEHADFGSRDGECEEVIQKAVGFIIIHDEVVT
jgi:hypothetical protein